MKKQLLLIAALVAASTLLSAQKTIVGTVKNDKGEALVGASISIKGTQMGVLTDVDGQFSLVLPQKMDTLVFSFVGHDTKEVAVTASKIAVVLNEGVLLNNVTVVGYNTYRRCYGCYCGVMVDHIGKWDSPLAATPLSNGATKLVYNVDVSWRGKKSAHTQRFKDKIVQYYISKSTDDVHYSLIGTSRSDTARQFKEEFLTTQMSLGSSQFLDKSLNKADSTYYLIEGYMVEVDEENNEGKDPKRELVYRQKTTVAPTEYLKIAQLYAQTASNQLELTVFSAKDAPTEFRLIDAKGRIVLTHQQRLFKKNNMLTLTYPDLASGMYVLSVVQGEQSDNWKWVLVK